MKYKYLSDQNEKPPANYRGRLAPTPSGKLHAGHLHTFGIATDRCRKCNGVLVYRDDDLDQNRCTPQYSKQAMQDIQNAGMEWQEGPYYQSQRMGMYLHYFHELLKTGLIYPCQKTRKEIQKHGQWKRTACKNNSATSFEEHLFPTSFRHLLAIKSITDPPAQFNWRFRVPDEKMIEFNDNRSGSHSFQAGVDFGDFLVWRKDGIPSYEFATVVDDHLMQITEIVRGEDLLLSTARQILLYEAMGWDYPEFYHCALVLDADGQKLSKRNQTRSTP